MKEIKIIPVAKKPSKYKNEKTIYNGIKYDSKKEAAYAQTLDLLKKAKGNDRVLRVERQVKMPIRMDNKLICTYILDFRVEYPDRLEFIDVKGFRTAIYRLKKKLVEAFYECQIKEV